jgi:putative membrane protein
MLSACVTSTLFLISYLYYHAHHGVTRFAGTGFVRPVYFVILATHTVLAVVIVPLILTVLYWAARRDYARHTMYARVTFPCWLYVSVTGVIIYWMIYRISW